MSSVPLHRHMNTPILKRSTWTYIGEDDGKGLNHTVTEISADGVTTWSDALPDGAITAVSGFSWFGPVEEFVKQFRFVKNNPFTPSPAQ
jgi:hypothetical protein